MLAFPTRVKNDGLAASLRAPFFSGTASASSTRCLNPSARPSRFWSIPRARQNPLDWTRNEISPLSQFVSCVESNDTLLGAGIALSSLARSDAGGMSLRTHHGPERRTTRTLSILSKDTLPCSRSWTASIFTSRHRWQGGMDQ